MGTATPLVAPVHIAGDDGFGVRSLIALLRLCVTLSRRLARGRGVAFACERVAHLVAHDGLVKFVLANGGRFLVEPSDRYWLLPLLVEGAYEKDVDRFLSRSVAPGDWFIDCGANVGIWSVALGARLRQRSHVIAVEPAASVFSQLDRNRKANGASFNCVQRALSDRSGVSVELFSPAGDHASATLLEQFAPEASSRESVSTISLNELLEMRTTCDEPSAVTFVKMDIEGMEAAVISGLDPTVHDDVMLLYEDHGRDPTSAATASALMRGLTVFLLEDDGGLRRIECQTSLRNLKRDVAHGYNLLAFAPGGRAAHRFDRTMGP
jgi:FkbM family methyltransferase